VIADGQHNHIQLYCCSVLPNAEMGNPVYQARYGMKLVPQVMRNVHDVIEDEEEVEEYLDIVVSTDAMPAADWRRAKVFAWMVDFAYFDRVLQIPLLMLHARHGWPVHEMIERLVDADPEAYPITARLVAALQEKALSIQQGGPEYFPIPEAGGMLWQGDQRSLITLVLEDSVEGFYTEIANLLGALLDERDCSLDRILLEEALTLNRAALTLPFQTTDQILMLSHNLWEHYQSLLVDRPMPIQEGLFVHRVNRSSRSWHSIDDWAKHLSWAQGKDKRAYLRTVNDPSRARRRTPVAVPA
jgi:hypothetical protein